jgi:hypothetical protein
MPRSFADDVRSFALSFEGAREEFSFGSDHPVFKAPNGKMSGQIKCGVTAPPIVRLVAALGSSLGIRTVAGQQASRRT